MKSSDRQQANLYAPRPFSRTGTRTRRSTGAVRLVASLLAMALLGACSFGSQPTPKPATSSAPGGPLGVSKGRFTATPVHSSMRLHLALPHPPRRALDGLLQLTRGGFLAGVPLQVSTTDEIPAGGITLKRSYAVPLPKGAVATWAFYNEATDAWQAIPSSISADRRTVTATVHHLSLWTNLTAVGHRVADTYTAALNGAGQAVDAAKHVLSQGAAKFHDWAAGAVDDVIAGAGNVADWTYYQVGKVFDTRVDAPACTKHRPDWADNVVYIETDRNNPLLFCAGFDNKHPDLLVLKARVNRGFAFTAHLTGQPSWTYNSTLDTSLLKAVRKVVDLPTDMELPAQQLAAGTATLVGPGEQLSVGLDQATVRAAGSDRPVLELRRPSVLVFLLSMLAHLATEQGMDSDTSWVSATVVIAHCASDITAAHGVAAAARAVLTCLGSASDAIGKQVARAMADAGKSVSQAKAAAGLTTRISIYLAVIGPVFNSMNFERQTHLDPAAGQVHVFLAPMCPSAAQIVAANKASPGTDPVHDVGPIKCASTWATALVDVYLGGTSSDGRRIYDAVVYVYHFVGGRWKLRDRRTSCESGQVPASIYKMACLSS